MFFCSQAHNLYRHCWFKVNWHSKMPPSAICYHFFFPHICETWIGLGCKMPHSSKSVNVLLFSNSEFIDDTIGELAFQAATFWYNPFLFVFSYKSLCKTLLIGGGLGWAARSHILINLLTLYFVLNSEFMQDAVKQSTSVCWWVGLQYATSWCTWCCS